MEAIIRKDSDCDNLSVKPRIVLHLNFSIEGETEPTPEECWQAFKQYYPGDYEEAMKIKRGEK